MPKTIQIRDLDDGVYTMLATRAAQNRLSVPEYLRREAERLAARPAMADWLQRVGSKPPSHIPTEDTVAYLRKIKGYDG